MPKVSDDYLARRREQILDAAVTAFARDGFAAASMADIIALSGLSVGAVYRYFPTKDSLVEASIRRVLNRGTDLLNAWLDASPAPSPAEIVLAAFELLTESPDGDHGSEGGGNENRLALMAWAESMHSDQVREVTASEFRRILASVAGAMRNRAGLAPGAPRADPDGLAQMLVALIIGLVVQDLVAGSLVTDECRQAMHALLDATARGEAAAG